MSSWSLNIIFYFFILITYHSNIVIDVIKELGSRSLLAKNTTSKLCNKHTIIVQSAYKYCPQAEENRIYKIAYGEVGISPSNLHLIFAAMTISYMVLLYRNETFFFFVFS